MAIDVRTEKKTKTAKLEPKHKAKRGRPPTDLHSAMKGKIALRTSEEDEQQISALSETLEGFQEAVITRAALRLGLSLLEEDPKLISDGIATRDRRRETLRALGLVAKS